MILWAVFTEGFSIIDYKIVFIYFYEDYFFNVIILN